MIRAQPQHPTTQRFRFREIAFVVESARISKGLLDAVSIECASRVGR
jgi:hypothetical protein